MAQRLSRKILNICIVGIIIVAILFIAMMLILNYKENGEANMPFEIKKISIISTVEGEDVEDNENKWNFNVSQNNDIYIYVEKNSKYNKQETIEAISIDNFDVQEKPLIGDIKIYKPSVNEASIFKNIEENETKELIFDGKNSSDLQNLQISNQGGILCFRCANVGVGNYKSNEKEEINHKQLLKNMGINEEELKAKVSFDITMKLNSGKTFKAKDVVIEIPNSNIVEEGTLGREITELNEIIFKRIEN